jgi:RNA polymerase sigma-70 factor (ECF subfamily)
MTSTDSPAGKRTDSELLQRLAAGDESAVGPLYDRYGPVLYAIVFRIVGQRADAEEVVMEAFAQAWRDARRFEAQRGSVAAWLTMMARSRALDLVRARERRQRITVAASREEEPDVAPAMGGWRGGPADRVEQAEQRNRVETALSQLSPVQRQAIELAFYEGLTQSEIAEQLKEPLGTIKTRVRLGMQKLRDALRPYYLEQGV